MCTVLARHRSTDAPEVGTLLLLLPALAAAAGASGVTSEDMLTRGLFLLTTAAVPRAVDLRHNRAEPVSMHWEAGDGTANGANPWQIGSDSSA